MPKYGHLRPVRPPEVFHTRALAPWGRALAWLVVCLLLGSRAAAQVQPTDSLRDTRTLRPGLRDPKTDPFYVPDSAAIARDSLQAKQDSVQRAARQAVSDSLKRTSALDERLSYEAADSITLDLTGRKMILYETAKVDYGTSKIRAARIEIDWAKTTMYAYGVPDSLHETYRDEPEFVDGEQTFYNHEVTYNYKTKKGKVIATKSQEGENAFQAEETKRQPDGSFFARNGIFTTCTADHPHYYFRSSRMKVIPGKNIITGPLFLTMDDVPLPIGLPFGFFPQRDKRTSGILFPIIGEDRNRGFNLRNFGYYLVLNEHVDLALVADYYFRGSYRVELRSTYRKIYGPSGDFTFEVGRNRQNQPGDDNFAQDDSYRLRWSHNQTFSPTARLSASVDYTSRTFLRNNSRLIQDVFQNNVNSSINFSKQFRHGWTLTAAARHSSQLTGEGLVTLELPRVNWSKQRFSPFESATASGPRRWYQDIGVSYTGQLLNQIQVRERSLFTPAGNDSFRLGMQQRVAVNTNFKVLGFVTVSPSFNLTEYWYPESRQPTAFEDTRLLDGTDTSGVDNFDTTYIDDLNTRGYRYGIAGTRTPGFAAARDYQLSVSANTTIYGLYETGNARRRAYRHTLRPTLSYTYRPDFSDPRYGFYRELPVDTVEAPTLQRFSRFDRFVLGGPGAGLSQTISLTINNLFETKVLEKADTTQKRRDASEKPKFKYTTLLNDLGFSLAYNFAADSFNWNLSPFVARTNLFNNKVQITASAFVNPYQRNAKGARVDRLYLQDKFTLGVLETFSLQTSFNLSPKGAKAKAAPTGKPANQAPTDRESQALREDTENVGLPPELVDRRRFEELYTDFSIPWTLSFNYGLNYSRVGTTPSTLTQTLNVSGGLQFTPKWRLNVNSGYDFTANALSFTSLGLSRDLHCWALNFTAVPFGSFTSYYLTISVNSSVLQDLKIQKRRDWRDGFVNP